jgi:signal transduction histidine kinase
MAFDNVLCGYNHNCNAPTPSCYGCCLISIDVLQPFFTIGQASFGFVSLTVAVEGIISPIPDVATYLRALMDPNFVASKGFAEIDEYGFLSVSDNGTGMDEVTRERIFDPRRWAGTRLGLSTIYGIVGQHKGYIVVNSDVSKRSTFSHDQQDI